MKVSIALLAAAPLAASAAHPQRVRKGASARRSNVQRRVQDAPAPEGAPEGVAVDPVPPEMMESMSLGFDVATVAATEPAKEEDVVTTVGATEPVKEEDLATTAAPTEPAKEEDVVTTGAATEPSKEEDLATTAAATEPAKEEDVVTTGAATEPAKEEDVVTTGAPTEPSKEEDVEMSMPEDEATSMSVAVEATEPPKEDEPMIEEPPMIEEMSMPELEMSVYEAVDDQPPFVEEVAEDAESDDVTEEEEPEYSGDDMAMVDPAVEGEGESGSMILGSSLAAIAITAAMMFM